MMYKRINNGCGARSWVLRSLTDPGGPVTSASFAPFWERLHPLRPEFDPSDASGGDAMLPKLVPHLTMRLLEEQSI